MSSKPFVHSFSATKKFKQCRRIFHEDRVLRKYPFVQGESAKRGDAVHLALSNFIGRSIVLPAEWKAELEDYAKALKGRAGVKKVEMRLGIRKDFTPCDYFDKDVYARCIIDYFNLNTAGDTVLLVDHKGLALDTLLPTPDGFTTMGGVAVGDYLLGGNGKPARVTLKSDVKNTRCYRVTFQSGASVVCDEEHLWNVVSGGEILTVPVEKLHQHRSIPVTAPIAPGTHVALPVTPYTLGLWLSDGRSMGGEICKPYPEVWQNVADEGWELGADSSRAGRATTRVVLGLVGSLRAAGVLNNKHIPDAYFRAPLEDRLALMRGLIDGDGSINRHRRQYVFSNCNERLAKDVAHLARTLGIPSRVHPQLTTGFGKTVRVYQTTFTAKAPYELCTIKHKKEALHAIVWPERTQLVRNAVTRVEEIPSVPTQCVSVDSPDRTYLCTDHYIPTHNTGKDGYPDVDQLLDNAVIVFAHYPEVERIKGVLAFVDHGTNVNAEFDREYLEDYQNQLMEDWSEIDIALETQEFPYGPGPLCPWCPKTDCPHWSPPRKK